MWIEAEALDQRDVGRKVTFRDDSTRRRRLPIVRVHSRNGQVHVLVWDEVNHREIPLSYGPGEALCVDYQWPFDRPLQSGA